MTIEISGIIIINLFLIFCFMGGLYWFNWWRTSSYSSGIDFGFSVFIMGFFTITLLCINGVITII